MKSAEIGSKFFWLDIPFIDLLQAKSEHWEKGRAVASIAIGPSCTTAGRPPTAAW